MPARKRSPKPRTPAPGSSAPPWEVVLKEIRAQNKVAIEVAEARHDEVRRELQNFRGEVHADMSVLRTIIQGHSIDIRDLKNGFARVETKVDRVEARVENIDERLGRVETKVENVDGRLGRVETRLDTMDARLEQVDAKIDKLLPLEDRVAALERRPA